MICNNSKNMPGFDFVHFSNYLMRQKKARIILPSRQYNFPVEIIYLLHPFSANRLFWANYFSQSCVESAIFILPESGRNWMINGANGLKYEDYFINELMPSVEGLFPTIKKRVIGGFSMGGATSFFFALRYPDLFDMAFSLAGAFNACDRVGNPYASLNQSLMPTESEHEYTWGPKDSLTRNIYNVRNLFDYAKVNLRTRYIFEVGLQDYQRIIEMNRNVHHFFSENKCIHAYNEISFGAHTKEYAYQGLARVLDRIIT